MRIIRCDFCGAEMTEPIEATMTEVTPWQMGWVVIEGKDGKKDACSKCKEKINAVDSQRRPEPHEEG